MKRKNKLRTEIKYGKNWMKEVSVYLPIRNIYYALDAYKIWFHAYDNTKRKTGTKIICIRFDDFTESEIIKDCYNQLEALRLLTS